jgi:hypothetical protein
MEPNVEKGFGCKSGTTKIVIHKEGFYTFYSSRSLSTWEGQKYTILVNILHVYRALFYPSLCSTK